MKILRAVFIAVLLFVATPARVDTFPQLDLFIWQGAQRTGGQGYLSSILLEDITVDGVTVTEGTPIYFWSLPTNRLMRNPQHIIGQCTVAGGRCVLSIEMPLALPSTSYAGIIYLPTYNAQMAYSWDWRPCE